MSLKEHKAQATPRCTPLAVSHCTAMLCCCIRLLHATPEPPVPWHQTDAHSECAVMGAPDASSQSVAPSLQVRCCCCALLLLCAAAAAAVRCCCCALPLRCLRAADSADTALMEAAPACVNRENTVKKEKMHPSLVGGLSVVLLVTAQVAPARAYDCTSDAGCQYDGCNDNSCACSSSYSSCVNGFWTDSQCNNGVWDAVCVSTTYISTTKQAETLCTVLSLSRITLLWRVLESGD